jgi:hypothetical protein
MPCVVRSWTIWYTSVPERETTPTGPSVQTSPGMMPTLALPGEMTPGQFGPIKDVLRPLSRTKLSTRAISRAGMCSVITMTVSTPASYASRAASAANRAGTKTIDVLAPVSLTASPTVSKIGVPS